MRTNSHQNSPSQHHCRAAAPVIIGAQLGCRPAHDRFVSLLAKTVEEDAIDTSELQRGLIVARQVWQEKTVGREGETRKIHPVLDHPAMRDILQRHLA